MARLTTHSPRGKVIIQAGGRGSRLRHITWNKPKCLAAVKGKPLLFHLLDSFPDYEFVVIGDYLFEILDGYLQVNPPVANLSLVHTKDSGTCAGIQAALNEVDDDEHFFVCWSDLLFPTDFEVPQLSETTVFVTNEFICRWRSVDGALAEMPGSTEGVCGLFYFQNKRDLANLPASGEFVRWISQNLAGSFVTRSLEGIAELGDFSELQAHNDLFLHNRFFNSVEISGERVVKRPIVESFSELNEKEVLWYEELEKRGFRYKPRLIARNPLTLQRIRGQHAFDLVDLSKRERAAVVNNAILTLESLHSLESKPVDQSELTAMYVDKTIDRIESVAQILPFWEKPSLTINGVKCNNWFSSKNLPDLGRAVFFSSREFSVIHGDPTFSNMLFDENLQCWLIDPRGTFGQTDLFGDPLYDFSKLYYSGVGGYDSFNRKAFKVYLDEFTCEILLEANPFKDVAERIFSERFSTLMPEIRVRHALIWAALTGYTRDDVDSVIGAYCLANLYLEEALSK